MSESRQQDGVGGFSRRLGDLPDANAVVHSPGDEPFSIRAECRRVLLLQWLGKSVAPFPGGDVPQLHRPVRAGAGEDFAVGSKRQPEHGAVVAGKRPDLLTRFNVPELDLLVVTTRSQHLAIGRNSERIDGVLMPFKNIEQFSIRKVPLSGLAQPSRFAATGKEE